LIEKLDAVLLLLDQFSGRDCHNAMAGLAQISRSVRQGLQLDRCGA